MCTSTIRILIILTILQYVSPQWGPDCTGENAPRCVCHMLATLEYLNEKATVSPSTLRMEPGIVSAVISNYHCIRHNLLPTVLRIRYHHQTLYSERRMRMRRSLEEDAEQSPVHDDDHYDNQNNIPYPRPQRSKRQIPLGYPSNDLFYQILPKLDSRADHQYIQLGGRATLHCRSGPYNQIMEGGGAPPVRKIFSWAHSDKRLVSGPEVSMDHRDGDLNFQAVQLSDSDLYTCNVSHIPGHASPHQPQPPPNEDHPSEVYHQQLDVVAEPIQWLRFVAEYYTPHCALDELTLINSNIVSLVHQHVCFFCPVRNHSVTCLSSDDFDEDNSPHDKKVLIRLAVSTIGLERKMMAFSGYSEACPLLCVELLHSKILQLVRDSLERMFALHIEVESPEGPEVSNYVPGRLTAEFLLGCPAGFYETHKLCLPCASGQFSPDGKSECFPCEEGSFQPTPGSGMCLPCPDGYSTMEEGSVGEYECKVKIFASIFGGKLWAKYYPWSMYGAATLAGVVVLVFLVCLIPCLCPNTRMGRCCAPCSCCGPDPDFEGRPKGRRKLGRRRSYERVEDTEEDDDYGVEMTHERKKIVELEEVKVQEDDDINDKNHDRDVIDIKRSSSTKQIDTFEQDDRKKILPMPEIPANKPTSVIIDNTKSVATPIKKTLSSSSSSVKVYIPKPPPLPLSPSVTRTSRKESTSKNNNNTQVTSERSLKNTKKNRMHNSNPPIPMSVLSEGTQTSQSKFTLGKGESSKSVQKSTSKLTPPISIHNHSIPMSVLSEGTQTSQSKFPLESSKSVSKSTRKITPQISTQEISKHRRIEDRNEFASLMIQPEVLNLHQAKEKKFMPTTTMTKLDMPKNKSHVHQNEFILDESPSGRNLPHSNKQIKFIPIPTSPMTKLDIQNQRHVHQNEFTPDESQVGMRNFHDVRKQSKFIPTMPMTKPDIPNERHVHENDLTSDESQARMRILHDVRKQSKFTPTMMTKPDIPNQHHVHQNDLTSDASQSGMRNLPRSSKSSKFIPIPTNNRMTKLDTQKHPHVHQNELTSDMTQPEMLNLHHIEQNQYIPTTTRLDIPQLRHVEQSHAFRGEKTIPYVITIDGNPRHQSMKSISSRIKNNMPPSPIPSSSSDGETEPLDVRQVSKNMDRDKRYQQQRNVNFDPVPKTRTIPGRSMMATALTETENGPESDEDTSTTTEAVDVRALAKQLNYQRVGQVSIRPTTNIWKRPQPQDDLANQVQSSRQISRSASSEFDINAPINVKKIASRLEKQRRFSAGLVQDLTSSGKIPPGAFTYTPSFPRTNPRV